MIEIRRQATGELLGYVPGELEGKPGLFSYFVELRPGGGSVAQRSLVAFSVVRFAGPATRRQWFALDPGDFDMETLRRLKGWCEVGAKA